MFKKFRMRGTRAAGTVALAAAFLVAMVGPAWADSPNPIPSTVHADMTENAGGTVTVTVRGEWDWTTHHSDCNQDRAGAGIAIVWNDPKDPGFDVDNGGGVQAGSQGNSLNAADGTVHPADIGDAATGAPGAPGQQYNSVSSPSDYASWKGGCGAYPVSGTPKGTFGYDGSAGYTHTYASKDDVSKICVVTYDVHGGGKVGDNKFQEVNGSKEIAIDGNHDNSISTNRFDTNSDCFTPTVVVPVGTIGVIGFAILLAGVMFFVQRRSRRQVVEA